MLLSGFESLMVVALKETCMMKYMTCNDFAVDNVCNKIPQHRKLYKTDYQVPTYIVLLKCFSSGRDIRKKLPIILKIYSVSTVKEGGATFKLAAKNITSEISNVMQEVGLRHLGCTYTLPLLTPWSIHGYQHI